VIAALATALCLAQAQPAPAREAPPPPARDGVEVERRPAQEPTPVPRRAQDGRDPARPDPDEDVIRNLELLEDLELLEHVDVFDPKAEG
jgi:hypothetical protein